MRKNRKEPYHLSVEPLQKEWFEEDMDLWEAMHFDFETVEVPEGLKEDVLQFVFAYEEKNATFAEKIKSQLHWIKAQFTPLTASLTAVMFVCLIWLASPYFQHRTGETLIEVTASMQLHMAEGVQGKVYGNAFMINKDGKEELVINVYDFPQPKGTEVYQVWLIDNGQRQSAGVFKPDRKGFGVLVVETSTFRSFDQIGITLEPDAKGKQPRGMKIVGT